MKKFQMRMLAFLVFFLSCQITKAQELTLEDIELTEEVVETDDIPMDAWTFTLQAPSETLVDHFQDFIKDQFNQKVKKINKSTWTVFMIEAPEISSKRADIKLVLDQELGKVGMIWLMGYDYWGNSIDFPAEMDAFRSLVINFEEFHYVQDVNTARIDINKALDKDKKNQRGLIKEQGQLIQTIEKAQEKFSKLKGKKKSKAELKIAQNQSRIIQIDKELSEVNPKISTQELEVASLNLQQSQIEAVFAELRAKLATTGGQ